MSLTKNRQVIEVSDLSLTPMTPRTKQRVLNGHFLKLFLTSHKVKSKIILDENVRGLGKIKKYNTLFYIYYLFLLLQVAQMLLT